MINPVVNFADEKSQHRTLPHSDEKQSDNNAPYLSRLEKFLFFFEMKELTKTCCCGCNLKVGVLMIIIVGTLETASIAINTFSNVSIAPMSILAILTFIGYSLLFYSTCNHDAKYAYYGYLICTILLLSRILVYSAVTIVVVVAFDRFVFLFRGISMGFVLIFYIVIFAMDIGLNLYYLIVIYSYSRNLAMNNLDAVNGVYQENQSINVVIVPEPSSNYQGIHIQTHHIVTNPVASMRNQLESVKDDH